MEVGLRTICWKHRLDFDSIKNKTMNRDEIVTLYTFKDIVEATLAVDKLKVALLLKLVL